jgi:hypothetical protein
VSGLAVPAPPVLNICCVLVPSSSHAEVFPHTLHSRHRQFSDPCELERHVTFRDRHHVRYTNEDGVVIHDQPIEVRYEFTTVESGIHFQGDLRKKDLVDCFDVDVVWTDSQGRTDTFGNVRGIGTVQRLKLWSDRVNTAHSLTVFANRSDRRYREFPIHEFEGEVRGRDDRRRTIRLNVRGRRGSAPESGRRMSLAAFRPRRGSSSGSSGQGGLDIRYLGIQFSRSEGREKLPPDGKRSRGSCTLTVTRLPTFLGYLGCGTQLR